MSTQYLTINSADLLPITKVKRLHIADDKDRASLAKLGDHVSADRFNTRIELAPKGKSYAVETIDELAYQGVALVQVDERAFVPAVNIIKARNLTPKDREAFKSKTGREMRDHFKAQVETVAGTLLTGITAEQVMQRLESPYMPEPVENAQTSSEPVANAESTPEP